MNPPVKIINQGAHGCILYRGIKCNGQKEDKDYVTKIQEKSKENEIEIEISDRIKQIPHFERYFAPILESCDLNLATLDIYNIKKCEPVNRAIQTKSTAFVSNKLRYMGKRTLYDSFMNSLKNHPDTFVYSLFETFFLMTKSISILLEHKIVHNDIKDNNIMTHPKTGRPILIDFGLSILIGAFDIKDAPTFLSSFDYDKILGHPYYPVDLALASYLVQNCPEKPDTQIDTGLALFKDSLKKVWFSESPIKNPMANFITNEESVTFEKEMETYLNTCATKTWENLYQEMMAYHWTWDLYAFCCLYIQFYQEVLDRLPEKNREKAEAFIELMKTQVYCLPEKRMTLKDLETKVKGIITPASEADSRIQ